MNKQKADRRPTGVLKGAPRDHGPADWDERPVKKAKAARPVPEEFSFLDDADFGGKKPARGATPASRPSKNRSAELPFGDDGYQRDKPLRPIKSTASYEDRPARKARYDEDERPVRKKRPVDEGYPVRAARGYDEELTVRKKPRAQGPRPIERYGRPRREEFEEFDRPVRRAASKPGHRKKKKESGALLYWAIAIVLALIIGFGVRTFGFELITVRGDAMRGTLTEGEISLVKKTVYYTQKPARGDIVAVNSPEGKLIRRVVALPGETIEIKGGVTYVNDEPLDESYVLTKSGGDYPLTTIPDGGYFVMSDNRLNTDDSRSFGLIKNTRSLIVGKVDFIVWPLTDWGSIG
jgi:signal peptidase I